ncbi:hypothetical protein WICPIJ_005691, partial [Wickerhamomyces pijperi]
AILGVSDLEKVSVKRLRGALEKLFVVEFEGGDKQKIKELILERYDEFTSGNIHPMRYLTKEEIAKEEAERKRKWEAENNLNSSPTKRKKSNNNKSKLSAEFVDDNDKHSSNSSGKARGWSAITFYMSPQLSQLLGMQPEDMIARPECVKQIWVYIKAHDLQDPNDKRQIICDDAMKRLFGDTVHMFTMNKMLGLHLSKDVEITKKEAFVDPKAFITNVKKETDKDSSVDLADLEQDVEDILQEDD